NSGLSFYGGGAEKCNLKDCLIAGNYADFGTGGGADTCNLVDCALVGNYSYDNGGAANAGSLVNCTVTANSASSFNSSGYGAAVYGASLTNCIVIGNFSSSSYPNTNYASCTMTYCCADPLATGTGNVDVNPQFAPDGYHLSQTSPCIGMGTASVVVGTDIDGQTWSNPPSIGCDEWYPQPIIGAQPYFQFGIPPHEMTCTVAVAGQVPLGFLWIKDGLPVADDGHHNNSGTSSLLINQFTPDDSGAYQVVVTNASGAATSAVVNVTIHGVSAAGSNPVAPYTSWATAATNIQDAINVAAPGDFVLVSNGVYASGGLAMTGGLTNRVSLNKAITVMSANGWQSTIIQGRWDPVSTNGPGAVRCAWLTNGAVLSGFTLQNGATLGAGDSIIGQPLQSGGGVWCPSTSSLVVNCFLTNNSASKGGGGACEGTIVNSLIMGNMALGGGGVAYSTLNNCTVLNNYSLFNGGGIGGGTYNSFVYNSIVLGNQDLPFLQTDNYFNNTTGQFYYSCSYPSILSPGDINTSDAKFIDLYHIATISPCYGKGNSAYASGYDMDGQPWNNPPSMGCSEIVASNLVGPLSVSVYSAWTFVFTNHLYSYGAAITGRAANVRWSFGDGPVYTNYADSAGHIWTNTGEYLVTATAYNNDNPGGVSGSLLVDVQQMLAPQIQAPVLLTNGLQIQFTAQTNASYTVQYTTNLTSGLWQSLPTIYYNQQATIQVLDPGITNSARFYRIYVQ
ncbi:MAG TPA: PKD domain-containing protein, partial [Candidatus Sulfotelmatobacter sp.]|nr:PKD domain-containing protein [Candidatus Sulfotelmatobacter sp.]